MIYLIASGLSAFFGLASSLGATTLLRPLLDAITPLPPTSVSAICTLATLCAALIAAFFALGEPVVLHPDELLMLAVGALTGGVLGELAAWRFSAVLLEEQAVLLQNALLFTLIALPSVYFSSLATTIRPLALSRYLSWPIGFIVGLLGSFLAFGAEPLTLSLYFFLFDAENDEAAEAALTCALCAMLGKLITLLVRTRFLLPHADILLFVIPGALIGGLCAMMPRLQRRGETRGSIFLGLSLFTSLLNMASSIV